MVGNNRGRNDGYIAGNDKERFFLEKVKDTYLPGMKVKGVVKNVLKFGVYARVWKHNSSDIHIDGLIKNEEISWKEKIFDARGLFYPGQEIDAIVMFVDEIHHRVILSIRRFEKDPWEHANSKYMIGQSVHGTVTHITNLTTYIEIEDGINGKMPVGEVVPWEINHPGEVVKVGDEVRTVIIKIDSDRRHIILSLKEEISNLESLIKSPVIQSTQSGEGITPIML